MPAPSSALSSLSPRPRPVAPGLHPLWFWNDEITVPEIRRQVGEMAAAGVRGFFIHARQGLRVPYLADAFLDLVGAAVDAAEEHGLTAHLYDEFPYPSGIAGGAVTQGRPEFAATHLTQRVHEVPAGGHVRIELPPGEVLACQAYLVDDDGAVLWSLPIDLLNCVGQLLTEESYELMGLTAYNRKRYFAAEPRPVLDATLAPRPHRIFVSVQEVVTWHKYWGGTVDVLNREAVERFLDLTHKRYATRFAPRFGHAIASIYTDETAPGWSRLLPAEFERRCGYELAPLLPALQDPTHPRHETLTRDLERVRYDLFVRSWERPVSHWCAQNHLRYTGEKPSMRLAQLRFMDWPGCEPGHTKAGAATDLLGAEIRGNARATASAAYFYGQEGALCECFHSLGWSGTLQDARLIAEGLVLMGICYLSPHGFFYSTHGLRKHDAPPSFFFQMPYWPLFGRLSARLDRLFQRFDGTHIAAEILVVEPSGGLPTREQRDAYARCLKGLHEAQRDFLIVDTDILQEARAEGGRVVARDVAARVVVVPPMRFVEQALEERLAEIERAGLAVVRWDDAAGTDDAVRRVLEAVAPSLRIAVTAGDSRRLQMVTRRGPAGRLWFLINSSSEPMALTLDAGAPLHEVPLSDGDVPLLASDAVTVSADGTATSMGFGRHLSAFESVLIAESGAALRPARGSLSEDESLGAPAEQSADGPDQALDAEHLDVADGTANRARAGGPRHSCAAPSEGGIATSPTVRLPVRGPMRVRALNANLLRMARWDLTLLDEAGQPTDATARVEAMPLLNQLEAGGLRFAPRLQHTFGLPARLALPEMRLRYTFAFECDFDGSVELVMEPDSVVGEWQARVNDGPGVGPEAFAPCAAHVRGSLGWAVGPYLRKGGNVVTLDVRTARGDGGLRTPPYLAGDFGVDLEGPRLAPRPETGAFEAYEENGLPYYAGVIEYDSAFDLAAAPPAGPCLAELDFPAPFEQACEVSCNGGPWQATPWSPYRVPLAAGALHIGANTLALRVYTALIRSFEGQWFDTEAHAYRDVGR